MAACVVVVHRPCSCQPLLQNTHQAQACKLWHLQVEEKQAPFLCLDLSFQYTMLKEGEPCSRDLQRFLN